jgi:hypothetical protein
MGYRSGQTTGDDQGGYDSRADADPSVGAGGGNHDSPQNYRRGIGLHRVDLEKKLKITL